MTKASKPLTALPQRAPTLTRVAAASALALLCALATLGCEHTLEERPSPERPEVRKTLATLRTLASLLDGRRLRESQTVPPHADGSGDDPTGLGALADGLVKGAVWGTHNVSFETSRGLIRGPGGTQEGSEQIYRANDQWGRPILYRCPGPVHVHGWDLYSLGPDGVDDHGAGDDVLVGREWDD